MRNSVVLLSIVVGVSACAGGGARSGPATPIRYGCGDLELVRSGDTLRMAAAGPDAAAVPGTLGFRDDTGDHFVAFPRSPTEVEAVEYVLPADRHADAIERVYDTSMGTTRVDWRMTRQRTCRAQGGYTDALLRWMEGATFAQLAADLALRDDGEARDLVRTALRRANRRYYSARR